MQAAVE